MILGSSSGKLRISKRKLALFGTIFKATGVGVGTGTTTRYTRYYLQDCTSTYG
jgi:ribose 5-phosphate isomerase